MSFKIGVLGLGKRSTDFYINLMHQKFNDLYGNYHTFPFLLYQIDFNEINPYLPNQFQVLEPILFEYFKKIEKLNVQKWIIPNITLHETFDKLKTEATIFHPLDLALKTLKKDKKNTIIILGTAYTMNSNYINSYFKNHKIKTLKITKEEQSFIDILRSKVYNNSESEIDINNYIKLIEKYNQKSSIVIACTELSILTDKISSKKSIDLARLQINAALDFQIKTNNHTSIKLD